jgi:hypothetical protein
VSRWNSACPHGVHRNSCRECRSERPHGAVAPVAAHTDDAAGIAAIRAAQRRFLRDVEADLANGTDETDKRVRRYIEESS